MISKEVIELGHEAIERFFKPVIETKDEISLVLTAHLYVEHWIELYIRYALPKSEKILDSVNLTFSEKLAIAESLGLDRNGKLNLAKAIRTLNRVRNNVAHGLEYKVSKNDLNLLSSLNLPTELKESMERTSIDSPRDEILAFCFAVHAYVSGYIEARVETKPVKKTEV